MQTTGGSTCFQYYMGDKMVKGRISINAKTTGHRAWLAAKGYNVSDVDGAIIVEGSEFITELDLGDSQESAITALKAIADKKALLTYSTRVRFPDGKTYFGFPVCGRLGAVSALVVSPLKANAQKTQANLDW